MDQPRISIVLANYNNGRFIGQTLDSILAQTFTDWELIVVDDCSTDDSLAVLARCSDPRIRVLKNERNEQVYHSLNRGIAESRGEWIAIQDSDDYWYPEKLAEQAAWLEDHPETGACFTWVDMVDEQDRRWTEAEEPLIGLYRADNRSGTAWVHDLLMNGNRLAQSSVLMRRSVLAQAGGYNESLVQLGDYDLWVRLAALAQLHVIKKPMMAVRRKRSGTSVSTVTPEVKRRSLAETELIAARVIPLLPDALFCEAFRTEMIKPEASQPAAIAWEKALMAQRLCASGEAARLVQERFAALLNDPASAAVIRDVYGVTQKDFYVQTAAPGGRLVSTVFFDRGQGFSAADTQRVETPRTQLTRIGTTVAVPGGVQALRFDPVEGERCLVRHVRVSCGARALTARPVGARSMGDVILFDTDDPQFIIPLGGAQGDVRIEMDVVCFDSQDGMADLAEHLLRLEKRSAPLQSVMQAVKQKLPGVKTRLRQSASGAARSFRSCEGLYFAARVAKAAVKDGPQAAKRLAEERQGYHRLPEKRVQTDEFQRPLDLVDAQEAKRQRETTFPRKLVFSILVPLYNTPLHFLDEMIQSVVDQTYGGWELCLADGSDDRHPEVADRCAEWTAKDGRIRYLRLTKNLGIAGNTNACIDMAAGDYLALFDHDDLLHPFALHEVMKAVCEQDADFVYTDEFVFESPCLRNIISTHYKPDFAPDNLRANNYICHFTCFSRKVLEQAGRFDPAFDGSQDHDLILRLTEQAEKIVHVPKMLYLWRSHAASVASDITAKPYAIAAGQNAVRAQLKRQGVEAQVDSCEQFPAMYRVTYALPERAALTIIVHGAGDKAARDRCLTSVRAHTHRPGVEVLEAAGPAQINAAAKRARGAYVLLLEEHAEVLEDRWADELLRQAARPEVGAAGGLLRYPDGMVAGGSLVLGAGRERLCDLAFRGWQGDATGYMGRLCYAQDVSAVSGVCMLLRKDKLLGLGGLDETMGAYADADLCLRLGAAGSRVIWTPEATVTWHVQKGTRPVGSAAEQEAFRARWAGKLSAGDPYYNPNFNLRSAGFDFAQRVQIR